MKWLAEGSSSYRQFASKSSVARCRSMTNIAKLLDNNEKLTFNGLKPAEFPNGSGTPLIVNSLNS
jgi:hypothetical protein